MPRRKARHRNTFRVKFQRTYHLQSFRTVVKYLRRITKNYPYLHADVDTFEEDPLNNLYTPLSVMQSLHPDLLAEAYAEDMRRLEAMAEELRAKMTVEEKDRMHQSLHDAHEPLNSQTQDDWPQAPEPSPENSGEAPPRPRVLYL